MPSQCPPMSTDAYRRFPALRHTCIFNSWPLLLLNLAPSLRSCLSHVHTCSLDLPATFSICPKSLLIVLANPCRFVKVPPVTSLVLLRVMLFECNYSEDKLRAPSSLVCHRLPATDSLWNDFFGRLDCSRSFTPSGSSSWTQLLRRST